VESKDGWPLRKIGVVQQPVKMRPQQTENDLCLQYWEKLVLMDLLGVW